MDNLSSDDFGITLEKACEFQQRLVNHLLEYKNESGICCVTQEELSKRLCVSQAWIVKTIRKLHMCDNCIEMVSLGKYVVHHSNLYEYGPINKVMTLFDRLKSDSTFELLPMKERAKSLSMSLKELQMSYGYIYTDVGLLHE